MRICPRGRLEEGSFSEFHKYLQYLSFLVLSSFVFLASYLFVVHIPGHSTSGCHYRRDAVSDGGDAMSLL